MAYDAKSLRPYHHKHVLTPIFHSYAVAYDAKSLRPYHHKHVLAPIFHSYAVAYDANSPFVVNKHFVLAHTHLRSLKKLHTGSRQCAVPSMYF